MSESERGPEEFSGEEEMLHESGAEEEEARTPPFSDDLPSSGNDDDSADEYVENNEDDRESEPEASQGPQLATEKLRDVPILSASANEGSLEQYSVEQPPRKRNREDEEDSDPTSFKTSTQTRKVPAKLIDKLWEYSDQATLDSLEKIINLSINKTIERYKPSSFQDTTKLNKKMTDAETVLFNAWLNSSNGKSFRSRLASTKLPKVNSMHSGTNFRNDENVFILNYDKLNQRKNFFETYLLAEMKQLFELESYYNKLKLNYQSDCNYLREFKKTVSISQSKMSDEIVDKNKQLKFDEFPKSELVIQVRPSNTMKYDPNLDDAPTRAVLLDLRDSLVQLTSQTKTLTNFNEKLQTFANLLDML